MKSWMRFLIAIICLFSAIGCYVFGAPAGGLVFLAIGVILEGAFWIMLFRKRTKKLS
jgi:uncharacterized membrane protein